MEQKAVKMDMKNIIRCHPERSEGSRFFVPLRMTKALKMTKKVIGLTVILGLFFIINLSAGITPKTDMNSYFEKANKLYEKSQFNDALEIYKNLYSQGLVSKDLFYNLSNTYYRLGKIGYAYLFIERAYRIAPRDEDIKHNRKFLLNLLGQKTNPMDGFFGFFSINELIYIGLIFYCLLFLLLILTVFSNSFFKTRKWYWIKLANLCCVIFVSLWIFFVYQLEYKSKSGVAICSDVPVYASPDIGSKAIFTMPDGKMFVMEQSENDANSWCNIYIQDKGLKGWVKRENVEII